MDLFGPTRTISLGEKKYNLVIIDDYSRYTWVMFLAHKDEDLTIFQKFYKKVANEKNITILVIRSDHGTKFEINQFDKFCCDHGISHNFLATQDTTIKWYSRKKEQDLMRDGQNHAL